MRLALPIIVLALVACGDNNPAADAGGDGSLPDANNSDVVIDAPSDAATSEGGDGGAAVSGTVAVTDIALVDPSALSVNGITGGAISLEFDNASDGKGGTVVSGTSPINDCVVTKYDPAHPPHGQLDGDAFTIADAPGDSGTTTGLLKTVGPCTYQTTFGGYVCISSNMTAQTVTAAGTNTTAPGTVAYMLTTPLTGQSLVGSYLVINGFADTKYNSGTSAFPIIAQPNDTTLVVIDQAATTDAPEAGASGISYSILNGWAPVPGAGAAATNFLGTGSISIAKPANSVWPAINITLDVPGQGWTLSDKGDPKALPLTGTAADLVFGCGNDTPNISGDDTCGDDTTAALKVMTVTGTATKQALTALPPFMMPKEVPGTDTWLSFQCAFLGTHSAKLTAAAGQAIIDFNPTRVEVRVINAGGTILQDNTSATNVLVGHGFVGHTDHP